jgi:L-fuconolactonase
MDAVGVDRAVISLVPGYRHELSQGVYRYDNSYAEEAAIRFPDRFASVARYDPFDPELEDLVAGTLERPGTLGIRIVSMFTATCN